MNGFAPSSSGQLLIWHGPPGTGKTFALGALADAWREWAALHYVADPEALLGDPAYLLEVMMFRESTGPRWKVIILEDAGELFQVGARRAVGQDLSRLLNVTDGMLGQGARALFVITNERADRTVPRGCGAPGQVRLSCVVRAVARRAGEAMVARARLCRRGQAPHEAGDHRRSVRDGKRADRPRATERRRRPLPVSRDIESMGGTPEWVNAIVGSSLAEGTPGAVEPSDAE